MKLKLFQRQKEFREVCSDDAMEKVIKLFLIKSMLGEIDFITSSGYYYTTTCVCRNGGGVDKFDYLTDYSEEYPNLIMIKFNKDYFISIKWPDEYTHDNIWVYVDEFDCDSTGEVAQYQLIGAWHLFDRFKRYYNTQTQQTDEILNDRC